MMPQSTGRAAEEGRKGAAELEHLERLANSLRPLASPVRLRLLRFLTNPHYLEEVASHLMLTRQAARKHLDQLGAIGVIEKRSGVRESGPVTEYVIHPQSIFLIYDEFEKLGSLRRENPPDVMTRTVAGPGQRFAPEPQPGPLLSIVRGFNVGQRFKLQAGTSKTWLIGRDERCDLHFDHDPYASNRHAEIRWEKGRFVLTDLRSTNGTTHNWALLPRGGEVELRHGDLVGIGKSLLLLWDASSPPGERRPAEIPHNTFL